MKKFIILSLTLCLLAINYAQAQRVPLVARCNNSVYINQVLPRQVGIIYPLDVPQQTSDCAVEVTSYRRGQLLVDLQWKNDKTGSFESFSGGVQGYPDEFRSYYLRNLRPGIYRLYYTWLNTPTCPGGGNIKVTKDGQGLGKLAEIVGWDYSNEVVVGAPDQSDNVVKFLDGNGRYIYNNATLDRYFDPSESISIDARESRLFDQYQISIVEFEGGNPNSPARSRSLGNTGWINNFTRPLGIEDLRAVWDPTGNDPNWQFTVGNAYRLQVTIRNSACGSLVDNFQWFYICNAAQLCRGGTDKAVVSASISPNPVTNTFIVNGFVFNPTPLVKDQLEIYDLAGKLVKKMDNIKGNEFEVNDLTSGAYFISVLRDNQKMFTKKLIISR
jgi:hypothetical protein